MKTSPGSPQRVAAHLERHARGCGEHLGRDAAEQEDLGDLRAGRVARGSQDVLRPPITPQSSIACLAGRRCPTPRATARGRPRRGASPSAPCSRATCTPAPGRRREARTCRAALLAHPQKVLLAEERLGRTCGSMAPLRRRAARSSGTAQGGGADDYAWFHPPPAAAHLRVQHDRALLLGGGHAPRDAARYGAPRGPPQPRAAAALQRTRGRQGSAAMGCRRRQPLSQRRRKAASAGVKCVPQGPRGRPRGRGTAVGLRRQAPPRPCPRAGRSRRRRTCPSPGGTRGGGGGRGWGGQPGSPQGLQRGGGCAQLQRRPLQPPAAAIQTSAMPRCGGARSPWAGAGGGGPGRAPESLRGPGQLTTARAECGASRRSPPR